MTIKNGQEVVANWMRTYGQKTPEKPTVPSLEVRKLRAKLILEEALETICHGLGLRVSISDSEETAWVDSNSITTNRTSLAFSEYYEPSLQQIADGLADLAVVTLGTNVACGIPAQECFDEVMRSNGSKMWTEHEVAAEVKDKSELEIWKIAKAGTVLALTANRTAKMVSDSSSISDRCWLVKDASGKVIKSPSYSPADFSKIL